MANHLRRQIREAVGTIVTGLTTTGARVFQSRDYPLQTADLPGLLIYTRRETSQPSTIHPGRVVERAVQVVIEGVAKATADLDDTLDQIAKEIEIAMAGPPAALLALSDDATLRSTDIDAQNAEKPTGHIRMTYLVEYSNAENAPDVAT